MKDAVKERILNYLKENGESTPTQIHQGCKIHYYLIGIYLTNLKQEEKITSRKNDNETITYYKIRESGK